MRSLGFAIVVVSAAFVVALAPLRAEAGNNSCNPSNCNQLGAQCGTPDNGCGSPLNCGGCNQGKTCNASYQCVASCSAATCASLGATCGTPSDGCGGTLSCGTCGNGLTCSTSTYTCASSCTPTTCGQLNATCGSPPNGCGGTLSCGTCNGNKICDSNYTCQNSNNVCTPTTCAALGANCGTPSDGCGGTLSCGTCGSGLSCSYGNVCVSALAGGSVQSTFPAGSIVIPMDQCFQKTDGSGPYSFNSSNLCVASAAISCPAAANYPSGNIRKAFGLIYLLASNQIPVHVILNNTKTALADTDFTVTPTGSLSAPAVSYLRYANGSYSVDSTAITLGANTSVNYLGMPFVIEASFAQQALKVIGDFNAANSGIFSDVNMHVANHPFSAPLYSTLATRPKPVGIGPNFGQITYFDESGITSVVPAGASYVTVTGSGTSWSYTWPSAYFGSNPACPSDICTTLAPTISGQPYRILDTVWTGDSDIQNWSALSDFFTNGGRALAVDTAVSAWEDPSTGKKFVGGASGLSGASRGAGTGDYCAEMGTKNGNAWPGPTLNYPASDVYLQIGDLTFVPVGGGQSSNWQFNGIPALNTDGLAATDVSNQGVKSNYFSAIHGRPVVNGTQTSGHVIYEGGGNAWHGNTTNKDAGLHVMYNTLVNAADDMINGWAVGEMTRSSPVGRLTGESYLGTFDWNLPPNPTLPGNVLWTPSNGTYPYLTGHFREYKAASTGTTLLSAVCDSSSSSSPCNWDGANGIPRWSQRRVYVGSVSGSTYTLTPASSMSGDATISYISTRLDHTVNGTVTGILGGVDYSTGAVIENKASGNVTVAGAQGRPTIAYVGARDGMLHAFCVVPEAGQSSCYGSYAVGSEIWAIIPPGVKAQMDAARVAGDWSKVNVGGALRVADVQDTFNGSASAVYRTVLIGATRDSGYVFALDISNPNPTNLNNDGLKLLWNNDGTRVNTGVTAYQMGTVQGTTIAVTGSTSPYVIATAAKTGTTAGVNTYVMRMRDGLIMASDQKTFTRQIPIAGGSLADLPSSAPAMPTVLDATGAGVDNTILVADVEGYVRKFSISAAGALGSPVTLFDTATGNCTSGQTCQPIGVSPAIARRGTTLGAFIGTGGVDWARGQATMSRVFGFDPASAGVATAFFNQALGTVYNPVAAGSNATAAAMPVRIYSQLSISGTDMYALGTTLAIDTYDQLLLPSLRPGTYGQVYRWGNLDSTIDTNATLLINQGDAFAGGVASALITNSTTSNGVLTLQSTNGVVRSSAVSTSLRNVTQNTSLAAQARPFATTGWFDLSDQ